MRTACLLLSGLLLVTGAAHAAQSSEIQNEGLLNSLEANHTLLAEYRDEYARLKKEQLSSPSETKQRKLVETKDKIIALKEDFEQLKSFLPLQNRAEMFIAELTAKKMRSPYIGSTYQMHEEALKCISEKKFREAIDLYQQIILQNPDDDEAYLIMGHTYLLVGQYRKAENAFHNAVHIDPNNINEITPFYENAVFQNPDDDMAYANLGFALLILGDVIKARDAFYESLRINPDNPIAQNGMMYVEKLTSRR